MTWVEDLRVDFESNIDRVRNMLALYSTLSSGQGRTSVVNADILRSAVVFLHATLEDLLRTIAENRLPAVASAEVLDTIPLVVGGKVKEKFSLGALVQYKEVSVKDVISQSITAYLERSSYNNVNEIASLFASIGLSNTVLLRGKGAMLTAMMRRRHWIVHRTDKNQKTGPGQHRALSLSKGSVEDWVRTVESFGMEVLLHIS